MTVIECAGDGLARGRAHGEQAREAIRAALATWRAHAGALAVELVGRSTLLETVRRRTPGLADELRGIAEGAGVPFGDLVAYNCMDEQWWMRRQHRDHGCSLLGAHGRTGVYLTQNMDLPPFMDGSQLVLRLRPDDGPEQLVLTAAGMLGLTGVNDAGVAVCVNTLGMLRTDPHGLPVAAVVRGALAHRTREEAAAFVRGTGHASGQHYAVADPGGIDSLECSAAGAVACGPEPLRRLVHTNHPLASTDIDVAALRALREEGRIQDSEARFAFLDRHLDPDHGPVEAASLLADRTAPVCMDPVADGPLSTFASVSFTLNEPPGQPVPRFRPGPPGTAAWQEVRWTS